MQLSKKMTLSLVLSLFSSSPLLANENKIKTIPDDEFQVPASREFKLNSSVNPCNDFYSYVCEVENTNFKLPESKSRYIYSFNDSAERIKNQRLQYINNLSTLSELTKQQKMIHNFYNSCMNTKERLNEEKEYLAEIKKIFSIKDKKQLLKKFAENSISGNFNFMHIFEFVNRSNSKQKDVMFYYALPFGAKEYYSDAKLMQEYEKVIQNFAKTINLNKMEGKAKFIVNFDKSMAKIYPTRAEMREFFSKDNTVSREKLIKDYPELYFEVMLNKIPKSVKINAIYGNILAELNKQLKTASLEDLQFLYLWNYLSFKDFRYSQPDFYKAVKKFNNEFFGSSEIDEPLDKECVKETVNAMDRILDFNVIQTFYKEFPEERVEKLVKNIQNTTLKNIQKNNWLSKSAKTIAEEKIKTIHFQLVKPKKLIDWDFEREIDLSPIKFINNQKLLTQSEFQKTLDDITLPVNKNEWKMSPLTVNAYYMPTANQFVMPIGILQPPFFDSSKPDYVNLGSMGMVVAHEIGHSIDDQGSKYDETGKVNPWMDKHDLEKFRQKTEKLVKLFAKDGVDGKLTLGENIADFVGVKNAFHTAFPESSNSDKEHQKQFFIQFGRAWCGVMQPKEKEYLLKIDPHSPIELRVNNQAKLSEEFEQSFSCKKTDPMVLSENERIALW
ncbi:M13 family metallopeptidase [Pigmentibacter sp. JX0631]|uniref:M13 family metallopeptidase n=1 Tax=Pigmentibacter sp. JX0631 TaxID=2976982 RepID=UPI00246900C5|nr:M13 family metallopeptidase [Pigmentibacter sp. JX0631]WGL60910.1 M13 family metallopeptidase [Pigmentibacter sp. JX0631]